MAAALASLYHRIRDAERPAVKVAQRLRHDPRPVRRKELAALRKSGHGISWLPARQKARALPPAGEHHLNGDRHRATITLDS
jgi:hypothetical protein